MLRFLNNTKITLGLRVNPGRCITRDFRDATALPMARTSVGKWSLFSSPKDRLSNATLTNSIRRGRPVTLGRVNMAICATRPESAFYPNLFRRSTAIHRIASARRLRGPPLGPWAGGNGTVPGRPLPTLPPPPPPLARCCGSTSSRCARRSSTRMCRTCC